MKEKEKLIIETSMKLFANKGFNATSVQEIVEECHISKGAFYLYFKSKDALLFAIMEHYFQMIYTSINEVEHADLPPYEKFQKQLERQLTEISRHKEFIVMQIRENAIPFNEKIESLLMEMKRESYHLYSRRLYEIYGPPIEPYIWDATMMIHGFFHSYLETIILDQIPLDFAYLSTFVLRRMDDMVDGLVKSGDEPVMRKERMETLLHVEKAQLCSLIGEASSKTEDENTRVSLDVIKEELEKEEPRKVVIKGMMANLESDPSLRPLLSALKEYTV